MTMAGDLPLQLTSFSGRESEIAQARSLLATNRLVTLTGAGGVGKTRLALELASRLASEYSDGVRLVEFAALRDPALMPHTVATALRLREESGPTMVAQLIQ